MLLHICGRRLVSAEATGAKAFDSFEEELIGCAPTAPDSAVPPVKMGHGDKLPTVGQVQVSPLGVDPAKLIALEFQLLLNSALPEPHVVHHDHISVELADEEARETLGQKVHEP